MTVRLSSPVTPGELDAFGVRVKGIEAGQWVVTAGVHYLDEGQTVRILEDQATPATKIANENSEVSRQDTEESKDEYSRNAERVHRRKQNEPGEDLY